MSLGIRTYRRGVPVGKWGEISVKMERELLTTTKISPSLTPKEGLILSLRKADLGRRTSDTGYRTSEFGVRNSDVGLYFEQSRSFLCLHCAIHINFPKLWIPPEPWHHISKVWNFKFSGKPCPGLGIICHRGSFNLWYPRDRPLTLSSSFLFLFSFFLSFFRLSIFLTLVCV